LLLLLVACGPAQTAPQQVPFVESAHDAPLPVPSNGGSVLASPEIVVVTFAGYAFADDVESMAEWIPTSRWLAAVASEYGVGAAKVLAKVRLAEAAPSFSSTSDFSAYVASKVGTALPPPSSSTFYAFVFPSGESFSDPSIGTMCSTFTGYHDAAPNRAYTFAAIGTCPKHVPNLSDVEQMERVFSHELVEAFTDPFGDGYAARDREDPWSYVGGGEVADVCDGQAREASFLVARSWSNAAAAAGLDPCQPSDPTVAYFNVAPSSLVVQHAHAGDTVALELTAFSTAETSDWIAQGVLGARDFNPLVEVGTSVVNNGRTDALTITVPDSAQPGTSALLLFRSYHPGDSSVALQPIVVRVD
jgi:hypothetical protein